MAVEASVVQSRVETMSTLELQRDWTGREPVIMSQVCFGLE